MAVLQSGSITPGHAAIWATDNVIRDGGAFRASQRVLASLNQADFNDTGDQPIILPPAVTAFQLTGIIVTNPLIPLSAAVGGFYPAASKGGTPIVAASQVYSSLVNAYDLLNATLAAAVATTRYSVANLVDWTIYFSLTTAQGDVAYGDIYIVGIDLSAPGT